MSLIQFSVNDFLVLEPFPKADMQTKVSGGVAIGGRDKLVALKVLVPMDCTNRHVPAGVRAVVRPEDANSPHAKVYIYNDQQFILYPYSRVFLFENEIPE